MAVMAEKTIAQLKAEYAKLIQDSFEDELSSPEKVKSNVRRIALDGVAALLGLRRDSYNEKWELNYTNNYNFPFRELIHSTLTEALRDMRPQMIEFVKDVVATKAFQKEIKYEYRAMLQRSIERLVESRANEEAERFVARMFDSEAGA